jgi:prepilin-type N-terminal cleavage/methylation domain-containing protein
MRANRANAMGSTRVLPYQDAAGVRRRDGFTLIEVLIVVAIMALLAGTVITFTSVSVSDAMQSSLQHNLYGIRLQIQLYQANHLGQYPSLNNNRLPQMLSATNSSGDIGPSGPDYPNGPYFNDPPVNPYDGSTHVAAVLTPGRQPTAVADSLGGWQYDQSNGSVWPNNPGYYANP